MLNFKGQVLFIQDEEKEFAVKDKNGVPTDQMKKHRVTQIQMLVPDGKFNRPIQVKAFDLPPTFSLPKVGDQWETPEVRSYDAITGLPVVNI